MKTKSRNTFLWGNQSMNTPTERLHCSCRSTHPPARSCPQPQARRFPSSPARTQLASAAGIDQHYSRTEGRARRLRLACTSRMDTIGICSAQRHVREGTARRGSCRSGIESSLLQLRICHAGTAHSQYRLLQALQFDTFDNNQERRRSMYLPDCRACRLGKHGRQTL